MKNVFVVIALALLAAWATTVHAAIPNPPPLNNHPVVDAANIIPDDAEAQLNQTLLNIAANSKHQVAVLTVPDMGGYEIEEYSLNAARFYKLGGMDADDGVLITIAPGQHKARIEVGRGLESMLTDEKSSLVMHNDMVPRFKAGDYVGGINAAVNDIGGIVTPLTPAQLMVQQRAEQRRQMRESERWAKIKDFLGEALAFVLGSGFLFMLYWVSTAPARKRKREEEQAARQAEQERLSREIAAELARNRELERIRREEEAKRAKEAKDKFDKWWNNASPSERAAYNAEQTRKAREREVEAERQREQAAARRRREEEDSSSSYSGGGYSSGGGYDSGSSSSSSSDSGFSGGGGSFDGGGASGSW